LANSDGYWLACISADQLHRGHTQSCCDCDINEILDRPANGKDHPEFGTMNRPIVVLGATGLIGRGVIAAAVKAGIPVIAVARDLRKLKALQAQHAGFDIEILPSTIRDDADGEALASSLRKRGRPLAGVIAAMCGTPGRGRLLDQPVASVRDELDGVLMPHLSAARHLLALLAEGNRGGHYILIGGPGTESPWAGYGPRSVAAAALSMVARVLHNEARAFDVRVQLLIVDSPANIDGDCLHLCARWPSALEIGLRAVDLIASRQHTAPTRAIVPFHKSPLPSSARPSGRTPSQTSIRPPESMDDASDRSLDDARRLLDNLTPTKNNEVSR
jgi:NAD(P)-dependent dehydrogenase (short-subunit alcohol dehydrogenase family)